MPPVSNPVLRALSVGTCALAASAALVLFSAGCATTTRQGPGASPQLTAPPSPPTAEPQTAAPGPSSTPTSPETSPPPLLPPGAPRLPWVNPARCLPVCAYDPAANLVRLNDRGDADEKGRHRVHGEILVPLQELLAAARAQGHELRLESAFRSYDDQARVFGSMKEAGRAARPGHSEHQLGLTVDLRLPTGAAIEWLAAHAKDHGFALSYPAFKQRITGYRPEPWHIRHVGVELARKLHESGGTLEELFRAHPELGESGSCGDCPLPASRMTCGDVPSGGRCERSVLVWCYDGALATVDCAVSGQRCGRSESGEGYDCIPSSPTTPPATSEAAAPARGAAAAPSSR